MHENDPTDKIPEDVLEAVSIMKTDPVDAKAEQEVRRSAAAIIDNWVHGSPLIREGMIRRMFPIEDQIKKDKPDWERGTNVFDRGNTNPITASSTGTGLRSQGKTPRDLRVEE